MNETAEELNANGQDAAALTETAPPAAQPSVDVDEMSDADFEAYLAGEYGEGSGDASDNNGQTTEPSAEQNTESDAQDDITDDIKGQTQQCYRSFATQQEWQSAIDRIVGDRLKGAHKTIGEYDALKRTIADYYGTDDADKAVELLQKDITEQTAQSRGIDADTYRRLQESERENRQFREQLDEIQRGREEAAKKERIYAIQNEWERQAAELKKSAPDFDLRASMQLPEFADYVVNKRLSVADAYYLVSREKQWQAARERAASKARRHAIPENGASRQTPGASTYTDVSRMSDTDFERYLEEHM